MKIKVFPGIVAVKPTDVKVGIIETAFQDERKKPKFGTVLEVGEPGFFDNAGRRPDIMCKKGDLIAYREFGESKIEIGTDTLIFIDARDILAVLEGVNNE